MKTPEGMTAETIIRKYLGNSNKPYTEQFRDEMRDDLFQLMNQQWNAALEAAAENAVIDYVDKESILKLKK